MNLSDDEFTVLMIAQQGEPMMPIGRWKPAVERLLELKYLRPQPSPQDPTGVFNCVITPEGRAAVKEKEDAPYRAMIETAGKIQATQTQIQDFAEQAAQLLEKAGLASSIVTGDAPEAAIRKWAKVITDRALEILHA